jgi:hypothetical protein
MFPGVKFPESAAAIINVHTDINQIINSKRTIAVEERRKALQQFMRDLSKIYQVRNSKPFRDFIKLDENVEVEGFTDSNYGPTSAYKTESKRLNLESPDVVSCKKDSGFKPYTGSKSKIK